MRPGDVLLSPRAIQSRLGKQQAGEIATRSGWRLRKETSSLTHLREHVRQWVQVQRVNELVGVKFN